MPNPAVLHTHSVKREHHLKIVDTYIHLNCPREHIIEPVFGEYRPDLYYRNSKGERICVEVQLTPISTKKMQSKIDDFVDEYGKKHDSRIMLLVSDNNYKDVKMPNKFELRRIAVPKEPYT